MHIATHNREVQLEANDQKPDYVNSEKQCGHNTNIYKMSQNDKKIKPNIGVVNDMNVSMLILYCSRVPLVHVMVYSLHWGRRALAYVV